MITNIKDSDSLPMKALDEIPEPESNAKSVTALVKDGSSVTGYQLSDDAIVTKEEGIEMAKNGEINGVGISHRNGKEYLKSLPDDTESNNLSHLPTVK